MGSSSAWSGGVRHGYDDVAAIANIEGYLHLTPPELPRGRDLNHMFQPVTLLKRTSSIPAKAKFTVGHDKWSHRADINQPETLYPHVKDNIDELLNHERVRRLSDYHIQVRSMPRSASGTLDETLHEAQRLLRRISDRDVDSDRRMRQHSRALRRLLSDSIREQVVVVAMQEIAYLLGRYQYRIEGAPRSIEECHGVLDEFDERTHYRRGNRR